LIVVDASAILDLILQRPTAAFLTNRILTETETLHAPHLLDLEVAQALRRWSRSGEIDPASARRRLESFLDFSIERYPHTLFLSRIWELRHNVTAYDAAYLALAEALNAPLITCDAALAASTGHRARIEVF
jgi:predicted nucleic acid-binding protein